MWLMLNNGFFSIVANRGDDRLLVRARRRGDIDRVFGAQALFTPCRDYAFRVLLERDEVAAVVMGQVLGIYATNFKDSVKDLDLKSAYSSVWSTMAGVQATRPWGGPARRGRQSRFSFGADDLVDAQEFGMGAGVGDAL